jgi:protein-L-isoaspartate(D-aspartate) O-methyltransferase
MDANETTQTSRMMDSQLEFGYQLVQNANVLRNASENMVNYAVARHNMVESQVRPNGITDHRIIAAMAVVAREDFVPAERKSIAYLDEDILLKPGARGQARYLIEPMAFARMVHLASIKPTDHVLIVGVGTGYGAQVVASLARFVVGLESDAELAGLAAAGVRSCPNVRIVEGNLVDGHAASGPYDVILIEGRIPRFPDGLFAQLANGGRVVAAIGDGDVSKIMVATLNDGHRSERSAFDVSIAPLPGFSATPPVFVF